MTNQIRELQVTPMPNFSEIPDAVDAPGLGFLPLASGWSLPQFSAAVFCAT
ncbi:hypothetical protein LP416_28055 [Polaromonas sp. P2-4]|nr:hypothetical protein LP416_28055 [Polaromonas sp. P2-4]